MVVTFPTVYLVVIYFISGCERFILHSLHTIVLPMVNKK